jgi:hypothetical protein
MDIREGTRFTILLNTEINRLRRGLPPGYIHGVARALGLESGVVAMWAAHPEWQTRVCSSEYLKDVPRCSNPRCGAPVGHLHVCG